MPTDYPTELELQLLKILWDDAPLPVREIRQRLAEQGHDIAHTTVITVLNIMVQKKFLYRRKKKNAFLFSPKAKQSSVRGDMVSDIVNRVFDGSARELMLSLLETSDVDADELREIKRLIQQKAKEAKQ
jgi:predicted transcriptional regulator